MDILELMSEKTVSVALALVVMYFYNKLVIDVLKERKDLIEALRTERKEWLNTAEHYLATIFEISRTMTEANTFVRTELHALRGKLTELMLKMEKKNESS